MNTFLQLCLLSTCNGDALCIRISITTHINIFSHLKYSSFTFELQLKGQPWIPTSINER